ncbi:replication factor C subunit 1 [Drosophila tropicalis]|uniref:replication factor C subunit 1 n=1 Tax=Drosophila tropicalis TaxID=46794 RepID=UPI0035ABA54A
MQRGINTYFKPVNGSTSAKKNEGREDETPKKAPKKRKALVISSDEDEIAASPQQPKKSRHANGHGNQKPTLSKLKAEVKPSPKQKVDPTLLFGGETKRIEAPKAKSKGMLEFEDEEIDRSLMEVDLNESVVADKPAERKEEPVKCSPEPPAPAKTKKSATPRVKKEPKHADLETSVLSDEDRHERKRQAAVLYQHYKNRSSCLNHGSKEIPKGAPDCLKGLTFVVTGILESMEREEAESVIKEYGGRVMTVVGKKLKYLVVGEEAGPKKLAVAEELKIPILSEDGLFDLIRELSGQSKGPQENDSKVKKEPTENIKKERTQAETAVKIKKEKDISPKTKIEKEKKNASPPKVKKEHEESNNNIKKYEEKLDTSSKKSEEKKPENVSSFRVKTEPRPEFEKESLSELNVAWVDKYKPTSIKEIVGQAGAASNVTKLLNWLTKWYTNHDGKKKLQRPNPWAKNDDGSFYKAALLSGPPGIGKTTTATLVVKELGFDAVEFNASDTRSKRLLKEEVSSLLGNKTLYGYCNGQSQAVSKKHVLIMDEVDGMAGNEDRGGMQELIALIKDSSVPIICMCNDRNHPKIRSLVNYCYDLRFQRPRIEQIKGRIMSICFKEKMKIPPAKVEEIIAATNNDIRQSINHIALLSASGERENQTQKAGVDKVASKDLKLGPWEVVRKVFTQEEHKHMNLNDKCDLFFHDYSMGPLFVQHNYLQVTPQGNRDTYMAKVAATADALSLGDLVEKRIRANSAWSLLPTQAIFSSVLPGEQMCGHFTGQINFPGWLGKNSKSNKRARLAQELHDHTRVCTSGSRLSIRLDYAPYLLNNIVRPLTEDGQEGVPASLQVMKDYHLLREDLDSLIELTAWPGKKSPMDSVDGRVKAALTRAYNKEVMPYSYSAQANIKKKRAEAATGDGEDGFLAGEEEGGEEGASQNVESENEEENDDLELDGLIKAKKKPSAAASSSKPSTSKKAAAGAAKPKAKAKK